MIIALIISLIIYISMIFSIKYRTAIASLGIGILLLYGTISKTYLASDAFKTFPIEIVILIITLALFSKIFENNGFFEYVGDKFLELSRERRLFIAVFIPFVMYATSLMMNNLSVILLFTFICLKLALSLRLPIIPILVSGLIASNIGGCPLPWADTPAVILTLYSDFSLIDFLTKLFIPCFIFILLLMLYTAWWFKREDKKLNESSKQRANNSFFFKSHMPRLHIPAPHISKHHAPAERSIVCDVNGESITIQLPPPPPPPHLMNSDNKKQSKFVKIYLPIMLFALFVISICISPFFNISIAYVSMFFLGITLLFTSSRPEELVNSLSILDSLVFISALFMISGTLEHFGILKLAVNYLISFTGDSKILIVLCIMLSAFVISTFLSAGPATATILPMCVELSPLVGNNIVYAALALGILAGSSMLPWSATGGPVMLSEVDRFLHSHDIEKEDKVRINEIYNLQHYISFSIPFSLVILGLSAIFLIIYTLISI